MKKHTIIFSLLLTLVSSISLACDIHGKGGFAPENDLNIPADREMAEKDGVASNEMTEAQFNQTLDKVEKAYKAILEEKLDMPFNVIKKWKKGSVNAIAYQKGGKASIEMWGGLARHHEVTTDALALVACHEIGHHIGGAPKYSGAQRSWASSEGQSDYFASLKCFRRVFENDDNFAIIKTMNVPASVKTQCQDSHGVMTGDYALCVRNSMAGLSLARLLNDISISILVKFWNKITPKKWNKKIVKPMFSTPSKSKVKTTSHSHPKAQCRLDTYFSASLCPVEYDVEVSQKDALAGTCEGMPVGSRPNCWFSAN